MDIIILLDKSKHMSHKKQNIYKHCQEIYQLFHSSCNISIIGFDESACLLWNSENGFRDFSQSLSLTYCGACAYYDSIGNEIYRYIHRHKERSAIFFLLSAGIDDCSIIFDALSFYRFVQYIEKNYPIQLTTWEDYSIMLEETKALPFSHEEKREEPFAGIWFRILNLFRL